ncbi:MAG: DUF420 domain-containing protein [Phycisphaeraceae bacterium]
MDPSVLPSINASLNAVAAVLLIVGVVLIKLKHVTAHKRCMLTAFAVSTAFLVLYITDKAIKRGVHTPFNAEGIVKTLYYVMLISHILLAMTVPVLAIWLIRLGLSERYDRHRRVAHIAWPIWMYVSITGVLIYVMLYHWNPQ